MVGSVSEIKSKGDFKNATESNTKLVVIDCYATWCGPCRLIAPRVVQYSQDYPDVDFHKLDVDEVADTAAELGIRVVPTFILFKNGGKVGEVVGANPAILKTAIEKYM